MPLQAQQIVARACTIAHAPGFTTAAGEYLNSLLSDLCQDRDLEVAAGTYYGNFNPGLSAPVGNSIYGSGPYPLPADFLRFKDPRSAFWTLLGVPYPMIPCDLSEFDMLVQQSDIQAYPYIIATDMSIQDMTEEGVVTSNGVFYVYSPPSGAYPFTIRYYRQMPDITTPESSAVVPWFPNQGYLIKKTAAWLMGEVDDERQSTWDGEADSILREYLLLKDNRSNRASTVSLDRRRFGNQFQLLRNTKRVGWTLVLGTALIAARAHGLWV